MTPSLWQRAELLHIAMPCLLQSDQHEDVEASADAQAQQCCTWESTLGNVNKSEHSRTVLNVCLH